MQREREIFWILNLNAKCKKYARAERWNKCEHGAIDRDGDEHGGVIEILNQQREVHDRNE